MMNLAHLSVCSAGRDSGQGLGRKVPTVAQTFLCRLCCGFRRKHRFAICVSDDQTLGGAVARQFAYDRALRAAPALAGDKREELARLASGHSAGDDDLEPPSKEDGDERPAERIDSFSVLLLTLILSFTAFVF